MGWSWARSFWRSGSCCCCATRITAPAARLRPSSNGRPISAAGCGRVSRNKGLPAWGERARCWESLAALARAIETEEAPAPLAGCLDAVSRLLELDAFEAAVLEATVALGRAPRLSVLRMRLIAAGEDVGLLVARAAGALPD